MRVLVIDNRVDMRQALEELLRSKGHDVVASVPDGPAALEAADEVALDVILLDLLLKSGESGLDLARALSSRRPDVPIVLMSMNSLHPAEVRASGAVAFVNKERLATVDLAALARGEESGSRETLAP